VIIFDCNGVLVESEQIAAAAAADEFAQAGIAITPELVIRYFSGRRPADMIATIEAITRRKLPAGFAAAVTAATVKRLRSCVLCRTQPMPSHGCADRSAWHPPRRPSVSGLAWKPQGWRGSSAFSSPQPTWQTASPHPIYSCTQHRGWAFRRPTAS